MMIARAIIWMLRLRPNILLYRSTDIFAPHAPRNCGDCGFTNTDNDTHVVLPPHAPRNCGDCGRCCLSIRAYRTPASRPPELRRLRLQCTAYALGLLSRLTPPGIAATAAAGPQAWRGRSWTASRPPELRRLRHGIWPSRRGSGRTASRPPELRRLRRNGSYRTNGCC